MSTLFSFAKPIAGGTIGQPFKVLVSSTPHPSDGPAQSSSFVRIAPIQASSDEKGGAQKIGKEEEGSFEVIPEAVSTTPTSEVIDNLKRPKKLLLMDKQGRMVRLGKPSMKGLVRKDETFNPSISTPKINRHPSDNATYRLTRIVRTDAFLTTSTSLDTTGSLTFLLSALPGISDCTSLFDAYRVLAIEVWIFPRFSTNTDRSYNPGLLATAVDYDGGTATYDELSQYPNVMVSSGLEGHYRSWAPGVIFVTPGPASSGLVVSPWLDCADTGVAHHGLNYGITPTSQVQTYDRVTRFHLEFKRVR